MRTEMNRERAMRLVRAACALFATAALGATLTGCGSGGGGSSTTTTEVVTGYVYDVATGTAPTATARVTIAGRSTTTGSDGSFALAAPAGLQSVAITATGYMSRNYTTTIPTVTNGQSVTLDPLWLTSQSGGNTAVAVGTVEDLSTVKPVAGATVTVAGISATTAADGTFTISDLPVGLGGATGAVIGEITAPKYQKRTITTDALGGYVLGTGSNDLGTLFITSSAISGNPPGGPYTITGIVTVASIPTAGIGVTLTGGASSTTVTNGIYSFWVAPGTYTITASDTGSSASTTVTVKSQSIPVTAATINLPQ